MTSSSEDAAQASITWQASGARLSAHLLGDQLEERRNELRATLPFRRVVTSADVAAFAVHIMTNTALTVATSDIDGGEQILRGPAS